MRIPDGYTEQEVLADIEHVTTALAAKMCFGFHEVDDMAQDGVVFALEAMEKFDPTQSHLRTFLYIHVRRRFINMKRNQYTRLTPPCSQCPFRKGEGCAEFEDKADCFKYAGWEKRNATKRSLMGSFDASEVRNEETNAMGPSQQSDAETAELVAIVDANLPVEMRADFCRMRDGVAVPKHRRDVIEETIRDIIDGVV
jgi:DNA-directed RNA polymerase specialized sigma24 family protein